MPTTAPLLTQTLTPVAGEVSVRLCVTSDRGRLVLLQRDDSGELHLPNLQARWRSATPRKMAEMLCTAAGLYLGEGSLRPVAARGDLARTPEVTYAARLRRRRPTLAGFCWVPVSQVACPLESRQVRDSRTLLGVR